ncbi:MAG: universal stress protein [Vicinamibacterales bacterium]
MTVTPDLRLTTVLVAVDFGEASGRAVALAGAIAQRAGAELHAIHAETMDAPAYFTAEQVEELLAERARVLEQGRQYLYRFVGERTKARVNATIECKAPADAILHAADDADLVVMGSHGRRGPSRWWLGSIAERVLRLTRRPLLVVHADGAADPAIAELAVHAGAGLTGVAAWALALEIGRLFDVPVHDRRGEAAWPPEPPTAPGSLLVVAAPADSERHWHSTVGAPLVRRPDGAVLFVPE